MSMKIIKYFHTKEEKQDKKEKEDWGKNHETYNGNPSYWARESEVGWQEEDAIYDHPTPMR